MRQLKTTGSASVAALAVAAAWSVSCGAANSSQGDAGGNYCAFSFSITPSTLEAPVTVVATVSVSQSGVSGFQTFNWSISHQGMTITPTDRTGDYSEIEFPADTPGIYSIAISGNIGGYPCTGSNSDINVLDPSGGSTMYRLRFVPAPGHPAPAQERNVTIPGGSDYSISAISLDSGTQVTATLRGPGAVPLAAYVRARQVGGLGAAIETFTGGSGELSLWLAPALYDILVVPADETLAPMRFPSVNITSLTELTLDQGTPVTGVVLDRSAQPLVGARVALRIDGVPSTIAQTDISGAFTVYARTGGVTEVSVVPPAGSGLPQLELGSSAGLVAAPGVPLTMRYAAALTSRTLSFEVRQADGVTAAANAPVTFIAETIAGAGTVTAQGGSGLNATGRVRLTAVADGAGNVSGLLVPEAGYTVLVEPAAATPGQVMRMMTLDLSAGTPSPTALSLATGGMIFGVVRDDEERPIPNVRVTATPEGVLTSSPAASASATTGADGSYTLRLVGNGQYALRYTSTTGSYGHRLDSVTAPATDMFSELDVALPAAIRVTGTINIPGLAPGVGGVSVSALCVDCSGADALRPRAEAVSAGDGAFTLAIPDPKAQIPSN